MKAAVWAIVGLVFAAPLFVVGLALVPFYFGEWICYRVCSRALFRFLGWVRRRNLAPRPAPGTAADLLAKQRRLRRHVNHRRPVRS
jgi:hypothetical protein